MITIKFTIESKADGVETHLLAEGVATEEESHFADHLCALLFECADQLLGKPEILAAAGRLDKVEAIRRRAHAKDN
jgi:hypothetical protein